MLAFMVAESLCRSVRRQRKSGTGIVRDGKLLHASVPAGERPAIDVPRGARYQLLRALRAMAGGEMMLVERRMSLPADDFTSADKRESWFGSLRPAGGWQEATDIEPLVVPGTAFPGLIGRILLRNGWSAPTCTPHWVPTLRFFRLTELGYMALGEVQTWWQTLTPTQRLRLMFSE